MIEVELVSQLGLVVEDNLLHDIRYSGGDDVALHLKK